MFSHRLNEAILTQIKSNDATLQTLQLGSCTYQELIALSRAITSNTNLRQISIYFLRSLLQMKECVLKVW